MCEIDIGNLKTRNFTNWFRYETIINLFEFKGYSTWGERDTIFLRWLFQLPQTTRAAPAANYWLGIGGPRKSTFPFGGRNSTHCFFSNRKNPQPTLPVRDVIHIPSSQFLSGIFILTSLNDTSSPHAREHLR